MHSVTSRALPGAFCHFPSTSERCLSLLKHYSNARCHLLSSIPLLSLASQVHSVTSQSQPDCKLSLTKCYSILLCHYLISTWRSMSLSNHSLLHSVTYQTIPEHTLFHFPNKTREHSFTSRALILHTLVTSQARPECSLSLPKQYLSTHSFTSRALFYQTVTSQALPSALCHFQSTTRVLSVTSQALPECSLSLPKQYPSTHSFTSRALFYHTVYLDLFELSRPFWAI